jgi:hypothetical protein
MVIAWIYPYAIMATMAFDPSSAFYPLLLLWGFGIEVQS